MRRRRTALLVAALIATWLGVIVWVAWIERGTPPPKRPSVGGVAYLGQDYYRDSLEQEVIVATDRSALLRCEQELGNAVLSWDARAWNRFVAMTKSGEVLLYPAGSKVRIIEAVGSSLRVHLLEGPRAGQEMWVSAAYVQATWTGRKRP